MPTARLGPSTGVIDGKIYVASGCCVDPLSQFPFRFTSLEIYDPLTNGWTIGAPIPTGVYGAATGTVNGKLYIAGGHARTSNIATLQIYDSILNAWSTGAPLPEASGGGVGAVIDGSVFVAGGMNAANTLGVATLRVYDPVLNTWTTRASMPTPRTAAGGVVINGKLYVVGGLLNGGGPGAAGIPGNPLEVYDPVSNSWSVKAPMPTPRYGLAVGAINGILYAAGGYDNVTHLATVEAYDPATNTWTPLGPMPQAHYAPGVASVGGQIYVFGGQDGPFSQIATTHVLDGPALQAAPSINVTGGSFTYDANSHPAHVTVTGAGGGAVFGDISVTYSPGGFAPPVNAGNYTANVTFTSHDPGYTNASVSVPNAIAINPARPTVVVTGGTFTYSGFSRFAGVSAFGVMGEQVFGSISTLYTPGGTTAPKNVGSYDVVATLTTFSGSNYTGATGTGVITITPSIATVNGPMSVTAEATNPAGTPVTFFVNAFDFDGPLTPICSRSSGASFPLGTTQVTCTASGANSNPGTLTFPVTVTDTRQPIIGPVGSITVPATSAQGAVVTFPMPGVSDNGDANPALTASPASGSIFPHGATTVTITARDASGNTASRNFTVTVTPTLTSISVTPSLATISPGSGRQFTANGIFTDGSSRILSSSGGTGGGGGTPGVSGLTWQARFIPTLRVDPCAPTSGGFSSQAFAANASGAVDQQWGQNNTVRATGSVDSVNVHLTISCSSGAGSPVTLDATWTGTRYEGQMIDFVGNAVQVSITGWSRKAPMPSPRFGLGAATLSVGGQDVVYAVGGASSGSPLATMESYHPATNAWTAEPSMPTAREGAGVAALNGHLFVVGGNAAGGVPSGAVESFDPATGQWNTAWPAMPTPRAHFSLVAANGRLYAIGGDASSGVVGTVERFDPATGWSTLNPLPFARRFMAAGALNNGGLIVVAGGSPAGGAATNRVDKYDVVTNAWTQGPNMLNAASGAVGVSAMNALFVFGGTNNGSLPFAQMYRPAAGLQFDGWAGMASMPTARAQAGAALVGDVIYVTGGQLGTSGEPGLPALEAFSLLSPDQFSLSQGSSGGGSTLPTVSWRLSPATGIASIGSGGFANGFAPGEVTVIAEGGGLSCLTTATCGTLRVQDTAAPMLSVPNFINAEATGPDGAPVTFVATAFDQVDGPVAVQCTPASGSTFALGSTRVACEASDASGNTAHRGFDVFVDDTTAPVIASVTPSLERLTPVNRQMVPVTIGVSVSDLVGPLPSCSIVSVSTNDDAPAADWQFDPGSLTVSLRAERGGRNETGRIYTIGIRCVDDFGNAAMGQATVAVPHDNRSK